MKNFDLKSGFFDIIIEFDRGNKLLYKNEVNEDFHCFLFRKHNDDDTETGSNNMQRKDKNDENNRIKAIRKRSHSEFSSTLIDFPEEIILIFIEHKISSTQRMITKSRRAV